jgi:undecaprenyl-diphosphatase
MEIRSGIILGAVQGLTEFLPISSSGHLILTRVILGLQSETGLAVDAVLQLATALAVGIYFRRDLYVLAKNFLWWVARRPLKSEDRAMLFALMIGTVPAIILGLLLEDLMETVFRNPFLVVGTLLLGAALMFAAELFSKRRSRKEITWKSGLAVGLFQCLALVPGMSRSGSTIAGGLFVGLKRSEAAKFSFLLSFPIISGSGFKKLLDLCGEGNLTDLGWGLVLGFLTAFMVGLTAIHFLIRYLRRRTLTVFVVYRVLLAGVMFWLLTVMATSL